MYPLVESIKILEGKPQYLKWHQIRYERTYRKYYTKDSTYKISQTLSIPKNYSVGLVKGRFCYNENDYFWEFHKYKPRETVTLKIINDNQINYSLKWTNRRNLKKLFAKRGNCDDILIIKNNFVTDTFSSNIIFFNGQKWITPSTPLLNGTCRMRLLDSRQIFEQNIELGDIWKFKKFQLINAMLGFNYNDGEAIVNIKK